MKALVLEEYGRVEVKEIEKPEADGNRLLIRIKAASVCGSDVHGYDGSSDRRRPPLVMGHEAAGVVEGIGPLAQGFKKGDRVTFNSTEFCGRCDNCFEGRQNECANGRLFGVSSADYHKEGAMAEYVTVPDYTAFRIPDNISFEEAALVEPLSIALHAVDRTDIRIGDIAVIFGAGTIGSMLLKLLKISNCAKVIVVDIDDIKLKLAEQNGADFCINPSSENLMEIVSGITGGKGVDLAFEAVGIEATIKYGIDILKKCGTFTLLGNVSKTIDFPVQKLVIKEINLVTSYACSTEYPRSLKLIGQGKVDVKNIISEIVPIERGQEIMQRLLKGEKGLMKAVFAL